MTDTPRPLIDGLKETPGGSPKRRELLGKRGKVILLVLITLACVLATLLGHDGWLANVSYDLPFKRRLKETNAVMVYVTEQTLNGRSFIDGVLDRQHLTKLLDRLTAERAKLVFLDFAFPTNNAPPGTNENFARAIRENGNVILGAKYSSHRLPGQATEISLAPMKSLRDSAAAWGHLNFLPPDPDFGVRRIATSLNDTANADLLGANLLLQRAGRPTNGLEGERWLNPIDSESAGIADVVFLETVLAEKGVPANFFRDKLVFVGAESRVPKIGEISDQFAGPWTWFNGTRVMGVDVHATALLNLWHGDFLRRPSVRIQCALVAGIGGVMTAMVLRLRRSSALWSLAILTFLVVGVSVWLHWHEYLWWSWLAVLIQGVVFSVVAIVGPVVKTVVPVVPPDVPKPAEQLGVFISYCREDGQSHANELFQALGKRGLDPWFDRKLRAGRFREGLEAQIGARPVFLLILTKAALKRLHNPTGVLRKEVESASARKKFFVILAFNDCDIDPNQWPEELRPIPENWHITPISHTSYDYEIDGVVADIRQAHS